MQADYIQSRADTGGPHRARQSAVNVFMHEAAWQMRPLTTNSFTAHQANDDDSSGEMDMRTQRVESRDLLPVDMQST
jgi:hypothetical protein